MQIEEIQNWWQSFYSTAPPISHILRERFPGFWMRIHSLPKSKRYPKTPSEYSILLERHNAVATEVLGHNSNCLLLVPRYVYVGSKKKRLPRLKNSNFELFSEIKAEDEEVISLIHWVNSRPNLTEDEIKNQIQEINSRNKTD